MATEFELSQALFLTYVGVGAAFLVLGSLVIFTGVIGRWGDWRLKRAQVRAEEEASQATVISVDSTADSKVAHIEPGIVAAIGAAVALAAEEYRREQAADEEPNLDAHPEINGGWREQGRMVAFDSRHLRERDR